MVLLFALKTLSAPRRWKLTVAHFNHCLRGWASDADETFVRRDAAAMKLPFVSARADVKKFAQASKLSIEMAARKLRHEFLAQAARRRKIKTIALAHHADDQVELFFLRLLRGAGGGALSGMKWRSPSPADKKISLVRPLLDVSRVELEQFARKNKIHWREDATNRYLDFLRNRIRHELLPLLRAHYQPALNKTILRLMEIVGAESDFAIETARTWLGGTVAAASPRETPDASPKRRGVASTFLQKSQHTQTDFAKLPDAIQRQTLKLQLTESGLAADFDLIESLRQFPNRPVAIGADVSLLRDEQGRISVRPHRAHEFDNHQLILELANARRASFDGMKIEWKLTACGKDALRFARDKMPGREFFDAERLGDEIILRHWRAGDRFQPIGLKSAVKLQDLFVNAKISRPARHKAVVAEGNGEIFWVEGLRISERFKLTPRTRRLLIWRWRR